MSYQKPDADWSDQESSEFPGRFSRSVVMLMPVILLNLLPSMFEID